MGPENARSSSAREPVWLVLTTALKAAASPTSLALAISGVLAASVLHAALDYVLAPSVEWRQHEAPFEIGFDWTQQANIGRNGWPLDPVCGVPYRMVYPLTALFRLGQDWSVLSYWLWMGVGNLAVWSFFGLGVSRIAVVRCGTGRDVGIREAVRFAGRKWWGVFGAPTATLAAIMLIAIPVFAASWLIRFDVGFLLVGIGWPVVLGFASLMAVLALGLMGSWPMMWGAIAAEDSDLFDAISRAFAYVLQKPFHFLAFSALAAILGAVSWLAACCFAETVMQLAYWCIQVGGGADRAVLIRNLAVEPGAASNWLTEQGGQWVGLYHSLIHGVVCAFSYAIFWSFASALYLLLRFETDHTLLDDIVDANPVEPGWDRPSQSVE